MWKPLLSGREDFLSLKNKEDVYAKALEFDRSWPLKHKCVFTSTPFSLKANQNNSNQKFIYIWLFKQVLFVQNKVVRLDGLVKQPHKFVYN